ncbi:type I-E CRISPR-associated protein Cse1/CasA [Streptomyces zhihengii]|uniref:Type I-E CRISPR-associated protein Cse1/CasA n=1 Tax=Streptomyces zhihengii TaxID=1818004 RepID=A0ABS2V436_9ACTN|nr:type I-E CRISPR-associated protein Cse1/CasA [Streptomyces zhihengii]MBM9624589.1 type I-E CRISPR-associated protein Cse1/CasA [Streptomyces zhihengii]
MSESTIRQASGGLAFDLTTEPWIPVLRTDGSQDELSLKQVFAQASGLRQILGDLPTQEFALLRLLLAVAHDALDGPATIKDWVQLWEDDNCFAPVGPYLSAHARRFDLLSIATPFFQTAGLRTAKGEISSLNRIVADVPNGEPFFTARMPGVKRLSFAEGARWVVHAHAYDTSGIKTGVVGDARAKNGKVYPLGVGWAGNLGGVFVERPTLRETLLMNLVATDTPGIEVDEHDEPAWRRQPTGPGAGERTPTGMRDIYTWQTRRLRLAFDNHGVTGVVLGYGDPLSPRNLHTCEPMTAWRRSPVQEKKLNESLVYLPREHDADAAAWRGIATLINARTNPDGTAEPPVMLRPRVMDWVSRLVSEGPLDSGLRVRARFVGAKYGTQQSVVDELVDEALVMDLALLHQVDTRCAEQAIAAVQDANRAALAVGDLAANLARAAGIDTEGPRTSARDRAYGAIDSSYRDWLINLPMARDPLKQRSIWQRDLVETASALGDQLLAAAGQAAWRGRTVATRQGTEWLNSATADRWFRRALYRDLGFPDQGLELRSPTAKPSEPDHRGRWSSAPRGTLGRDTGMAEGTARDGSRDKVITLAALHLAHLQRGYLDQQSHIVAGVARLRGNLGRDVSAQNGLRDLIRRSPSVIPGGEWLLTEGEAQQAAEALQAALALWAVHQHARSTAMHERDPDGRSRRGLGAALRRMMRPGEIDEPLRKRMVRAGTAADLPALTNRLRDIIVYLRRDSVPIDYALLAGQFYTWQQPDGADAVRQEWGRSFQTWPTKAAAPSTLDISDETTRTMNTDKDAS